jgi:hypothetical protein
VRSGTLCVGLEDAADGNPKKKRRSTEVNRHLPVNSKSLIGCSRLAFMTANNDPLGVEFCLSVSRGRTREEGPLVSASTPNWLSP